MSVYLIALLLFIIAPLGTLIHEGGHALGAMFVKADYVTLTIGTGKRVFHVSLGNVSLIVYGLFFLGGAASNARHTPYTRWEIVVISLCGPFFNGIIAIILIYWPNVTFLPLQIFMLYNLWLAVVNIIPFRIGRKQSDGYTALRTLLT